MLNVSMSRTKAFKSIDSAVQKKFDKDLNEIIKQNVNSDPDVLNLFNTILANSAEDVVPYFDILVEKVNAIQKKGTNYDKVLN